MSDVSLTLKRTLNTTPEKAFNAWIDPEQVKQWFGPEGFVNTVHTLEAKEGGAYRVTMKAPDGSEHTVKGVFQTLDRPHKLVMTWVWEGGMEGMSDETLVTVEFNEVNGKTDMTMTHSKFPNEEAKENHNKGWSSSFNKLEQIFA